MTRFILWLRSFRASSLLSSAALLTIVASIIIQSVPLALSAIALAVLSTKENKC
jgi:hypothetical protein